MLYILYIYIYIYMWAEFVSSRLQSRAQWDNGLEDIQIQIIDVTDVCQPTIREVFWVENINCYDPQGLNAIEL